MLLLRVYSGTPPSPNMFKQSSIYSVKLKRRIFLKNIGYFKVAEMSLLKVAWLN